MPTRCSRRLSGPAQPHKANSPERASTHDERRSSSAALRHTKFTCKGETQATPLFARSARWSAIRQSIFRDNGHLGSRGTQDDQNMFITISASAVLEEAFARSRDRPDANLCFEAAPDTSRIMPLQ